MVNEDNEEEEELWCHKFGIKASNLKVYFKLILLQTHFPVWGCYTVEEDQKGDSSEEFYVGGGESREQAQKQVFSS